MAGHCLILASTESRDRSLSARQNLRQDAEAAHRTGAPKWAQRRPRVLASFQPVTLCFWPLEQKLGERHQTSLKVRSQLVSLRDGQAGGIIYLTDWQASKFDWNSGVLPNA